MGLLAFPAANASDGISGGLLNLAQPVSGLLAPPQASVTAGPNWLDALGAISAAMKDAGAFMQHQPDAATNVAQLARLRSGAPPAPAVLSRLPPNILAAALLGAAQQRLPVPATNRPVPPPPTGVPPANLPSQAAAMPESTGTVNTDPTGVPPPGFGDLVWQHMTPQQRALWKF